MKITLENAKKQRIFRDLPLNMKITGWLSPFLIYLFARFGISPNIISFCWIIIAFLGFFFISLGGYINSVIGILIYHFALLLDSVDGGLARIMGRTNAGGEFLDRFFSTLNRFLIFFAMGFGLYSLTREINFFYLGIWCGGFVLLSNIVKIKGYESLINSGRYDIIKNKVKRLRGSGADLKFQIFEMFRPANAFTLSFFAILFNVINWYLYLFAIIAPLQFLFDFVREFELLRHTKQRF